MSAPDPAPRTPSQLEHPTALLGGLTLGSMNIAHRRLHAWGIDALDLRPTDRVLDVGCGGGSVLRRVLRLTRAEVGGVDQSATSVAVSLRTNRAAAASGRLRVREGTAQAIPFASSLFDVVTAFETVYFWPDLRAGLHEARRVLRPGGRLLVVNGVADLQAAGGWAQRLSMSVPDGEELVAAARDAGFDSARWEREPRHGWLRVIALTEPH